MPAKKNSISSVKSEDVVSLEQDRKGFIKMLAPDNWVHIDCTEVFYDGEVEVKNGIAYVPEENAHWVTRMEMNGYSRA